MSRNGFLESPSLSFAPVVVLLSDGGPIYKYEKPLQELNRNRWFEYSLKTAIAIGPKAKTEILSLFTGDPDAVFRTLNSESLSEMLRLTVLTSSEIGNRCTALSDNDIDIEKQRELVKELKKVAESYGDVEED